MGIFSQRDEQGTASATPTPRVWDSSRQPTNGTVNSLLGQGSRFQGVARIEGTLRVEGVYEGTVEVTETLVIAKPGEFSGEIHARDVIVSGKLKGTVEASGAVELQRGCQFEGDVRTQTFIVEEGVFFRGNCHMEEQAVAADPEVGVPVSARRRDRERSPRGRDPRGDGGDPTISSNGGHAAEGDLGLESAESRGVV